MAVFSLTLSGQNGWLAQSRTNELAKLYLVGVLATTNGGFISPSVLLLEGFENILNFDFGILVDKGCL